MLINCRVLRQIFGEIDSDTEYGRMFTPGSFGDADWKAALRADDLTEHNERQLDATCFELS